MVKKFRAKRFVLEREKPEYCEYLQVPPGSQGTRRCFFVSIHVVDVALSFPSGHEARGRMQGSRSRNIGVQLAVFRSRLLPHK